MANDAITFTQVKTANFPNGRVEMVLRGTGASDAADTHVVAGIVGPGIWRCIQKSTHVPAGTVTERFGRAAGFTDGTDDEISVFDVSTSTADRSSEAWTIDLGEGESLYYKPTPDIAGRTVTVRLHLVQGGH